jgi:hypothetical protein
MFSNDFGKLRSLSNDFERYRAKAFAQLFQQHCFKIMQNGISSN